MKKNKIIILSICFLTLLCLCGCKRRTTAILFNSEPITKETILHNTNEFMMGKRIYYIFLTEKPLKSNIIRVEVKKKDEKSEFWGIKLVYGNDYRLSKDQIYYYNDYIVLHESGHYYMFVYLKDNLDKPLAYSDFYVK